ncbi:MAG: S49 family peptidase [Cyanobium sp. 49614_E6]|jgi:signal peptide peptidase SppA|nr:S49 family peptidase [Cyanobium sp. 49614_E6]
MTVLDVLNAPWAILPNRLEEIQAIYAARSRGEELDIAAIEARIGRPLGADQQQGYEVRNGAALIPLHGVLAQRMNLMTNMSGGTSTELFARDVQTAAADPTVKAIILLADTPGGTVAGTQSAAAAVRAARGTKPMATMVQDLMASAGVWIGSATGLVVLASGTAQVGSIGVVATHQDISQREQALGVKTTEIVAGKFKRAASQYGPLTETGEQMIQDQVDYLYSLFVNDQAVDRGVSVDKVLSDMADGRMFIGQQAIDAGLADQISSLDMLIAQLTATPGASSGRRSAPVLRSPAQSAMDENQLTAQTTAEWLAANPEVVASLKAEGAESERQRIAAVRARSLPGHEALIDRLAADGKTTGPEAADAVLAAEKSNLASRAAVRMVDAAPAVAYAAAPDALSEAKEPQKVEPTAQEMADRAKDLVAKAKADGRILTATAAVAQARRELTQP